MFYLILLYLMMIYIFRSKIDEKFIFILSLIPILFIIWSRYGLGADYFSYMDMYEKITVDSFSGLFKNYGNIEVGYKLIMYPFRLIGIPFWAFVGVINSVVTVVLLKWIKDNSEVFSMSVLLFYSMFFFVWVLSALRQSIVLAFALYYLFNEKKKLNTRNTVCLILALSLVHKSALILFAFMILRKVRWTKTLHIAFLLIGIVITFLPMGQIIQFFDFIPGVGRIAKYYLDSSVKFYDFPGLIRLAMFVLLIVFYDKTGSKKKFADLALNGFSIYFYLKFSELTASRMTIYTFFLMLILIPAIVSNFSFNKRYINSVLIPVLIISGSFVYFTKEYRTMFQQSFYLEKLTWKSYPHLLNQDITKFGSLYSYDIHFREETEKLKEGYLNDYKDRGSTKYKEDDKYITVKEGSKYGVLNQNGDWLIEPEMKSKIEVIDGVLIEKYYEKSEFFERYRLTDLSNKERSFDEMKAAVQEYRNDKEFLVHKEKRIGKDVELLPESMREFYPNSDELEEVIINEIETTESYQLARIKYQNRFTYIYLDVDGNVILDVPTRTGNIYDSGFVTVSAYEGKIVMNENGEIIWWENE